MGNLTVSRADFLDAVIEGSSNAFQYSIPGVEGMATRCFPLLLAGNRTESTFHGVDLVLAYPLMPVDIIDKSPGNETLIQQMLYEILSAFKADLIEYDMNNPLRLADLSAINREKVEQCLIAEGFTVEGDVAYRSKITTRWQHLNEILDRFGPLFTREVKLPAKSSVDVLLDLCTTAFEKIDEWPPPSTVAIRSR